MEALYEAAEFYFLQQIFFQIYILRFSANVCACLLRHVRIDTAKTVKFNSEHKIFAVLNMLKKWLSEEVQLSLIIAFL